MFTLKKLTPSFTFSQQEKEIMHKEFQLQACSLPAQRRGRNLFVTTCKWADKNTCIDSTQRSVPWDLTGVWLCDGDGGGNRGLRSDQEYGINPKGEGLMEAATTREPPETNPTTLFLMRFSRIHKFRPIAHSTTLISLLNTLYKLHCNEQAELARYK